MLEMYQEDASLPQEKNPKGGFRVRGNRIHFISLGCPRNLVDTEVMLGILLKSGYEAAEEMNEADYIIINTCGFLKASRNESLAAIDEVLSGKKIRGKGYRNRVHGSDS